MAFASNPEPCMPTPMMPKRTRSLGGMVLDASGIFSGSSRIDRFTVMPSIVRAVAYAPVAPAARWRNSRRDKSFFMEALLEEAEQAQQKTKKGKKQAQT